jgi:hypothetical protein
MSIHIPIPGPHQAPTLALTGGQLDEIAALAQRIAAYELRDENLPRGAIVPYEKLPEDKRRDVRALTRRIIQALVMLGHVEA